tara:strand:+ start:104 stop:871 length:768 start_codon:yes stop_codon:yes gene_type:complete
MKPLANAMNLNNGNNQALENEAKFRTEAVEKHLKENKVSRCTPEMRQTIATTTPAIYHFNHAMLKTWQYYLALGEKIIKLESEYKTKNDKLWGQIKDSLGLSDPKKSKNGLLEETAYKLARKVVLWKSEVNFYYNNAGFKPFEMDVTKRTNGTLKKFSNKYARNLAVTPSTVIKQIEDYYKANMPKEFERVTGNKVKTPQPTKKVEVKKPTQKQMGTVAKTLKPLPAPVIKTYQKTVITKDMVGLTIEELLAKVA